MRLVVGLGNPGPEYERTRHNVGFMVVDHLAARWEIRLRHGRALRLGEGRFGGQPVMLIEPLRYMNLSGEALASLPFSWCAEDLVVVHDDVDLPAGRLRLRRNGGTGGHRGLESLVSRCGTDFDRVRIGVGRPPQGTDVADYVLAPMTPEESGEFAPVIERAGEAVECLIREGLDRASSRFNACVGGTGQ